MHIPDGFLDIKTAAAAAALSAGALWAAVRQTRARLPQRQVPLMGLSAAFVFAAQMLNFPVAGGTSGHLVGGVLCSVLLGPSAAVLVISCVLIVQCFAFADGGVLALGANIFNMAVVSSVGGYFIYRAVARVVPGPRGRLAAVALASWVSTVAAAVVCAGQLALSRKAPWSVVFPAMALVHMLIGVGEAVITTLVVFTVSQTRPELLNSGSPRPRGATGEFLAFGLVLSLGLALFVSPFASKWPDGLDRFAADHGLGGAQPLLVAAPMPNYQFPGLRSLSAATAVAGVIGTALMFGVGYGLARVLVPGPASSSTLADAAAGPGD